MPWGKLYTGLHDHPKTRKARRGGDRPRDAAAMGLWVLALSWCLDNYETDGWVPADELDRWDSDAETLAQRLADARYWTRAERDGEDGWQFHDYADHQRTAAEVDAEREASRDRMRKLRSGSVRKNTKRTGPARSADVRDSEADTDTDTNTPPRKPRAATPDGAAETFPTFWQRYPRRVGKAAAEKAWAKALRRADSETILAGLGAAVSGWQACGTEAKFIPHPATWLNAARWEDDQTLPAAETPQAPAQAAAKLPPLPPPPPDLSPREANEWLRNKRREQQAVLAGGDAR